MTPKERKEHRRLRLIELIDANFKKNQALFADAAQIAANLVSRYVNGSKGIGEDMRDKIERNTGFHGWFDGAVSATPKDHENTEHGPDISGSVPLISWVQAGEWTEITDNFAPGDAEDWLPCPVKVGPHAFVLRVRGESMYNPHGRPSFQNGDLIFVDPDRHADHGSLVVVRLDDSKEATFKKLIVEGDKRYLRALNPAWPEKMIQINGNATICGVVVFKGEKL